MENKLTTVHWNVIFGLCLLHPAGVLLDRTTPLWFAFSSSISRTSAVFWVRERRREVDSTSGAAVGVDEAPQILEMVAISASHTPFEIFRWQVVLVIPVSTVWNTRWQKYTAQLLRTGQLCTSWYGEETYCALSQMMWRNTFVVWLLKRKLYMPPMWTHTNILTQISLTLLLLQLEYTSGTTSCWQNKRWI